MSKIICDVCGTSYPETANQCPICGCAKAVAGDTKDSGAVYTYVKGGRFSTKNVRKRNRAAQVPVASQPEDETPQPEKDNKDKGLVITAIALLLVIVAIVIYIAMRFFLPGAADKETTNAYQDTTSAAEATTGTTGPVEIVCEDLTLTDGVIELDKAGAAWLLSVTPVPNDTTDEITFTSADPKIASVTQGGKIVAEGAGQTIITVTCGTVTKQCRVVCGFEEETTAETTEETTAPVDENFKLNREDFTLANKGDTWLLYTGDVPASQITWSVDDEKVVTVSNGTVTAVGPGYTTVRATYNGTEVKCIVRCGFTEQNTGSGGGIAGTGGVSEDGGQVSTGTSYDLSHNDVTIRVGESFNISLQDASGNAVAVTFSSANANTCSVSGSSVTGVAAGMSSVSATYNGVTYTCIVRVI